jgi:hypothetical protein
MKECWAAERNLIYAFKGLATLTVAYTSVNSVHVYIMLGINGTVQVGSGDLLPNS